MRSQVIASMENINWNLLYSLKQLAKQTDNEIHLESSPDELKIKGIKLMNILLDDVENGIDTDSISAGLLKAYKVKIAGELQFGIEFFYIDYNGVYPSV